MHTPDGKECRYFYGDYYRGREHEECRLLKDSALPWKPVLCETCPVPEILLSNACNHMVLEPKLIRPFPYFRQQVEVRSYCLQSKRGNFDPHIGCGQCHPLPPVFIDNPGNPEINS